MNEAALREAVLESRNRSWAALRSKDRSALEAVLAADFISRSPGEPNQGRDAFIRTLTSFPGQALEIGSDNFEIAVYGAVAVVTALQTARLRLADDQTIENRIAITNVFRMKGTHGS